MTGQPLEHVALLAVASRLKTALLSAREAVEDRNEDAALEALDAIESMIEELHLAAVERAHETKQVSV